MTSAVCNKENADSRRNTETTENREGKKEVESRVREKREKKYAAQFERMKGNTLK